VKCSVEKLSALVDGELGERAARKLRAHVDGCAGCKRALADLETMKRGLGALPERAGDDNWSVLVNRLAAQKAAPPPRALPLPWKWTLTALGVVALIVGAAGYVRWHRARGFNPDTVIAQAEAEFHKADAHYRRAVAELRVVAEKQRDSWPLPKRAEYEAAQAQLEAAVARCRQVAETEPADVDAQDLLFAAYRKEIRFFEDQMMREQQ
jgi:hypothetical protein